MDVPALKARLPARCEIDAAGVRIGVIHDAGRVAGRHDRLRSWFPGCDVIVYGHSHQPEITSIGGCWIVNPGSPTERRRAPEHTMAVIAGGLPALVEL